MRSLISLLAAFLLPTLALSTASSPSDSKKTKPVEIPCTIHSPHTGSFFDLNAISVLPLDPSKKPSKSDKTTSWHALGWDYGANFTMNFCAPVIEDLGEIVGVKKELWANVSAFYEENGKTFSIGQLSSEPVFRGRKLVLNYTDGSPCPSADSDSTSSPSRQKNTLISLLCDRDPLSPPVHLSFVGTPDHCSYFFEARTFAACSTTSTQEASLSPGGVFGVIFGIAVAVYLLGGCVYQRVVMQQRGWKQLPNFSLWAGIVSFFGDIFIITFSSCARMLHIPMSRSGGSGGGRYSFIGGSGANRTHSRNSDDENRLIDQLDEEWDD
ncbi:MAG: Cation-independent mannose-6-phosphate receptor CI-MPR [Cirrosporium novae-zelandiae]|nr:MAG: Cation-independent mannose-6-phosphate receptor CI-MPR [Cirrosporium novae-zelandiae]